jgi:hypothetical protein
MRARVAALRLGLVLGVALAACTSPESTRMRAGGPGADTGNHRASAAVQMHEGSLPFWHTPRRLADSLQAPIDSARQADRLSRGVVEPAASPGERK